MNIPKIKFKLMNLEDNIEFIKWAYYEKTDVLNVYDYTIMLFPELSNIDSSLNKNEVYKIIEEVVTDNYKKSLKQMKNAVTRYTSLWKKYNDVYFNKLSNYLETDWYEELEVIECEIGLLPVYPRYLDKNSFSISGFEEDWKLIETCAHECLHFLWFKKWKELYPKTPKEEFDSPYLVWQYSEMVTDPILNNSPFSDMFDFIEHGYDSFYELYDGDRLVMDNLRKIYSENISINQKIDNGFEYIKSILNIRNNIK